MYEKQRREMDVELQTLRRCPEAVDGREGS
jgi:hypothetical protein